MKSIIKPKLNFTPTRPVGPTASKTAERTLPFSKKSSWRQMVNFFVHKPTTLREQLLLMVTCICIIQMVWVGRRQESSMYTWLPETIQQREPGQPPSRHGYLPAMQVMPASDDDCANALGIPKVALMFLTPGPLHHEEVWKLWFKSAAGVVPKQSLLLSVCNAEGASERLEEAFSACEKFSANHNSSLQDPISNEISAQHLFSVYIHAPPGFLGYARGSLWYNRLIKHRVHTQWGAHSLVEATRHLLWEAYRDPLNTRFLLLSETDLPLYDPLTLWQQLQAEQNSRVDTCRHQNTSPWRWDPRMETKRMKFHHWRKSPQWLAMKRDHVSLVLKDEEVYRKFERYCWSSWDAENSRWHRDCFSDEHYFATLLAVEGRDREGVCGSRGVSHTVWQENAAHPRSFFPSDIDAELFRSAREEPSELSDGSIAPSCDWGVAQAQAIDLFLNKNDALQPKSLVDMCGRLWRKPPNFTAKMSPTCFLTSRKYPEVSRGRVKEVFTHCRNRLWIIRKDVCEEEARKSESASIIWPLEQ